MIHLTHWLAYHPKGFKIAVNTLFQLVEIHYHNGSILRPKPYRYWIERLARERQELETCEFALLRLLALRWHKGCFYDVWPGTRDPTLLLHGFFEEEEEFLTWLGYWWENIRRLATRCRKRSMVIALTTKVMGHFIPPELLEKVQDEICDGGRVRELLRKVYEVSIAGLDSVWKAREGRWVEWIFLELAI